LYRQLPQLLPHLRPDQVEKENEIQQALHERSRLMLN
jgi:hypothetical protein